MSDTDPDPRTQLHTALRRLHRHETELRKLRALLDAELARAQEWFDDAAAGETREIGRLRNEIDAWAREYRDDRTKSWSSPWGTVTTVATKGRTVVDDEPGYRAWCEANGYSTPQPAKLLTGDVRKKATLDPDTGQLLFPAGAVGWVAVPGVHVESDDAFNVRIRVDGDTADLDINGHDF